MAENIYIMCPVRKVEKKEKEFLDNYVAEQEALGHNVHYPPRDVDQNDPTGYGICDSHREAMSNATRVDCYWNPGSQGSIFDFGMLFMKQIPLRIINPEPVTRTEGKSYQNVLLEYAAQFE